MEGLGGRRPQTAATTAHLIMRYDSPISDEMTYLKNNERNRIKHFSHYYTFMSDSILKECV